MDGCKRCPFLDSNTTSDRFWAVVKKSGVQDTHMGIIFRDQHLHRQPQCNNDAEVILSDGHLDVQSLYCVYWRLKEDAIYKRPGKHV